MLTLSIHAQEPSHFTIGQEKLIGLDIYDLHQDRQLNYWITTNNGLFKFDGYKITQLPCVGMLGNSLFNLTEDQHGNIYCSNLNGQLFKINDAGCNLYYTIPDSLVARNISFNFDDQNRLIVFSKDIFQVTEDKNPALLYDHYFYSHSRVYKTSKNKLISYNSGQGDLITIENGKIKSLEVEIDNKLITPKIIEIENQLIIYNRSTLKQLSDKFNSTKFELPKMKTARNDYRLYSDTKSLWIANLTGGVYYYKDTSYISEPTNLIFENSIISCHLKDHEGNTLLGTFGKGIIVIPNTGFKDIHFENTNSEVNKVTKMNDKSLIFGTQAGEIIKRDSLGKTTKIVSQGIKRIELLKNIPELDALFFNGKKNTTLHDNFQ
ncbi:hypothetical protein DIT68_06510 [Brumimicrobium oceani]|uniref:Uncharacterized protein n=1 Tax=Brumimicrobium oceani TaxID=2100725 RepID=A0A2U2XEK6_9FLAO|nr:hypothetical protein DIT68_06510 [Brumimicrobium oceani]